MGNSVLTWGAAIDRFIPGSGEILCVDTWAPYLAADDVNFDGAYKVMDKAASSELAYSVFRHNASCVSKKTRVDHVRGESKHVLPMLRDRAFDIVSSSRWRKSMKATSAPISTATPSSIRRLARPITPA
jgi:hypothetical protein